MRATLDEFESNFMREPSYNWNPPICSTLMAVGKNDIDDQHDYDNFVDQTTDNNVSFNEADSDTSRLTTSQRMEFHPVSGASTDNNDSFDEADSDTSRLTASQRMEFHPVSGASTSRLYAELNQSINNSAFPEVVFSQTY